MTALTPAADRALLPFGTEVAHRTVQASDGTPLAVQCLGAPGQPVVLLVNGLGATLSAYRHVVRALIPHFRVVTWDYRGTFGSGRPLDGQRALSIAHHAEDGHVVLRALGIHAADTPVIALAWSMGVSVALDMWRQKPGVFSALITHGGLPERPLNHLFGSQHAERWLPWVLSALGRSERVVHATMDRLVRWPGSAALAVRAGIAHHAMDKRMFQEIAAGFLGLDLELYVQQMQALAAFDGRDVVPTVTCPALVLAGSEDPIAPLPDSAAFAAALPGGRFEVLPGGSHYAVVEFPELAFAHMRAFLGRHGLLGGA